MRTISNPIYLIFTILFTICIIVLIIQMFSYSDSAIPITIGCSILMIVFSAILSETPYNTYSETIYLEEMPQQNFYQYIGDSLSYKENNQVKIIDMENVRKKNIQILYQNNEKPYMNIEWDEKINKETVKSVQIYLNDNEK